MMSEIGITSPNFGKAVREFVDNCFTCAIIRQKHPDGSRGSRVPLTLKGRPYQNVNLDTFCLGKVRLNRGTRNVLRKNQLLAVCCLLSGHLSLEPIKSLSPNSISGALWHVEETHKTRILSV